LTEYLKSIDCSVEELYREVRAWRCVGRPSTRPRVSGLRLIPSPKTLPPPHIVSQVRETQTETTDPYLKMFIDCLLASADYDSFYKVRPSPSMWPINVPARPLFYPLCTCLSSGDAP